MAAAGLAGVNFWDCAALRSLCKIFPSQGDRAIATAAGICCLTTKAGECLNMILNTTTTVYPGTAMCEARRISL